MKLFNKIMIAIFWTFSQIISKCIITSLGIFFFFIFSLFNFEEKQNIRQKTEKKVHVEHITELEVGGCIKKYLWGILFCFAAICCFINKMKFDYLLLVWMKGWNFKILLKLRNLNPTSCDLSSNESKSTIYKIDKNFQMINK